MKYLMKPGRCANGAQRDHGTVIHAVDTDYEWGSMEPALCGTRPGRKTPGWSSYEHEVPTCPRCLKKLAKVTRPGGDDWGETVDYLLAHAPEPEPTYESPEPPEDYDDEDKPHYDTPGGY